MWSLRYPGVLKAISAISPLPTTSFQPLGLNMSNRPLPRSTTAMDVSHRRQQQRAPSFDGLVAGGKPARDPYLTRVVIMVDEATEPGLTDEQAAKHRSAIVSLLLNRGQNMPPSLHNTDPGPAVAYALRKRLKSEDELAVLSTLTLLDELMRVVPYFYRQVANEKFFRRLWRFVVPDYKNGVKSMIPIFGKPKLHAGYRDHSEVANRVKILIRAWAEELSVMFEGRYEPHAGFLIERYNSKRTRIQFPEVPRTGTPWVCPVDLSRLGAYFKETKSRAPADEAITLAGAENTVELFANLVENASRIEDLKEEVCQELAQRCMHISNNLTKLSMSMSKEEELTRAITVSEKLQKALALYKRSLENGRIERAIPVVDSASLESEEERYDRGGPRPMSSRSLERYNSMPPRSFQYSDSSEYSSSGRRDWDSRERIDWRAKDRPQRTRYDAERASESRRGLPAEERDERARPREYRRSVTATPTSKRRVSPEEKGKDVSGEKREKRELVKARGRREKSDSDLPKVAKEKKKLSSKKKNLISVQDESSSESSSDEEDANTQAFTMLAERYSTKPSQKHKSKPRESKHSKAGKPSSAQTSNSAVTPSSSTQNMPPISNLSINPAAYYSSVPGMGYNPMMMMPNPYAMYGSVAHVPMQDPMGMYKAYQTVNPAMYYNTVSPQMYPSFSPNVPGLPQMTNFQTTGGGPSSAAGPSSSAPPPSLTGQSVEMGTGIGQLDASRMPTEMPGSRDPSPPSGSMPSPPLMNSFYSSVPGMPVMPQPMMPQPGFVPTPSDGTTVSTALGTQSAPDGQAEAYRNAMNQAAVAYHAAAAMYRSVQGEAPVVAQQMPATNRPISGVPVSSKNSSVPSGAVSEVRKGEETKE
ncbi:hypothetical protein FGB62_5g040 [Gracilaria domingensis]|nr:hypothetical protein FGB62_5g040 [Gracilaria domingensis]